MYEVQKYSHMTNKRKIEGCGRKWLWSILKYLMVMIYFKVLAYQLYELG
jgi:hypothetical protein